VNAVIAENADSGKRRAPNAKRADSCPLQRALFEILITDYRPPIGYLQALTLSGDQLMLFGVKADCPILAIEGEFSNLLH
jgi:hypothetical protein